jgi:hypothetical protein
MAEDFLSNCFRDAELSQVGSARSPEIMRSERRRCPVDLARSRRAAKTIWNLWFNAMPQNEMIAGFKAAQEQGIRFGKQNIEAGLNFASDLANATSLQDMLDIQTTYAQTQVLIFSCQAQELARLMAEAAKNLQPRG